MNFFTLFGLSALLHGYIAFRLVPGVAAFPLAQQAVLLFFVLSALLTPLGLVVRRFVRPPLADRLSWVGLLCMGLFSSLFVLTLLRDVLSGVLWLVSLGTPGPLDWQAWRMASARAVLLLAGLAALLGFVNARRTAAVVPVDVPIPGLPAPWQGFTVAQISDIHIGPTIRERDLRRIVERVNALQADVVAVTGDLVDGGVAELGAQVAPLAAGSASTSSGEQPSRLAISPAWGSRMVGQSERWALAACAGKA